MAEPCLMKRFRRNAVHAIDSFCFTPIDRNHRTLIMRAAEALELRTKGKGCKSGVLKQSGLTVLRCLLFTFCAIPSGICCPSYKAIREETGYCTSTIAGALKRLETAGILRITRRIIRTPAGARQTSNAYAFSEFAQGERKPDFDNRRETTNLFKNKSIQPNLPGLQPVQLPFKLQQSLWNLGRSMGLSEAELQSKGLRYSY
jgi:Helix-turn-helix domain